MSQINFPFKFRRIVGHKLSNNFREATSIEEIEITQIEANKVFVKNHYAAINASDINYTSGSYPGTKLPLYPGFESLGVVVSIGNQVTKLKVGDVVVISTGDSQFCEYQVIDENIPVKVPKLNPEFVPLLVSGLTASISLEHFGKIKSGENVLVTAAAGGTGQFAVQLAKLSGAHVIGTCSSDDKVTFLKEIGCDRVINYNKEDFENVLKTEYPKGINVVYESVGGEFFNIAAKNLAIGGRLIIIGLISNYQSKSENSLDSASLCSLLTLKSATVSGFFLIQFLNEVPKHSINLITLYSQGKLKSQVDPTKFVGLEQIPDAIDFMYERKNIGKILVHINQ